MPTNIDDELDITDLDPDDVVVPRFGDGRPQRKKRKHVQWSGAFLGLLAGISGLVAGRLGLVWPAFDVFSQFGLQSIALTLAFATACLLPRRKAFIGVLLTLLFCLSYGLWGLASIGETAKGPWTLMPGEKELRVAHFNLFVKNHDLSAISTEIGRLDADVITLIEFTPEKQPLLQMLRPLYPYQFDCIKQSACDFAILSKYPLASVDANIAWNGAPFILARLAGAMHGITVYGIHTTHFPDTVGQLSQISGLVKRLEAETGPLIVMGDFNATPYSRVARTLAKGADLVRLTNLPTWPSSFGIPQLAIDHIFASPDIRVLARQQIGNNAGSDHYPIVMTLAVTPR